MSCSFVVGFVFLDAVGPINGDSSAENKSLFCNSVGLLESVGEEVPKLLDGAESGTFCLLLGCFLAEELGEEPVVLGGS